MLRGELYNSMDPELVADRQRAESLPLILNQRDDPDQRRSLLGKLPGSFGENSVVRSNFFCDYGYNIHLGRNVFLNFNCILLDMTAIRIGDGSVVTRDVAPGTVVAGNPARCSAGSADSQHAGIGSRARSAILDSVIFPPGEPIAYPLPRFACLRRPQRHALDGNAGAVGRHRP
jgi:acetyltransferase-like isoleucine patch superfamily enzyme